MTLNFRGNESKGEGADQDCKQDIKDIARISYDRFSALSGTGEDINTYHVLH